MPKPNNEKEALMEKLDLTYRTTVHPEDAKNVRQIVESSGFFNDSEIEIAVELVQELLQKGEVSGYYFVFAENNGRCIAYTCFGPIPATQSSYDLYWIAVHDDFRGQGIGRKILEYTEKLIGRMGGTRVYIETSGRKQYLPTRKFYASCGYSLVARLDDFYAPGDAKIIYVKPLRG